MGKRILLVEAAASSRILWTVRLAEAGLAVAQASGMSAALATARREPPAVAVIDADLVEGQPIGLARALRALPGLSRLPVLMLARCPGAAFRLAALAAGAAEVLEKPIAPDCLIAWIRHLLRASAREAEFTEIGPLPALEEPAERHAPERPAQIALVGAEGRAGDWSGLAGALAPHPCQRTTPARAADDLAALQGLELVAIEAAGMSEDGLVDCLARLHCLPACREAAFVVFGASGGGRAPVRLLEMRIDDLLPAGAGLAERRLRILRALAARRRRAERRAALRRGLELSVTDPLTGLANRRLALHRLAELAAAATAAEPLAVLMIDIDHFKRVNDSLGHPAGDAVLREVARRMQAAMAEGELLARVGGEEFLAILPGTRGGAARDRAEALREAVAARPIAVSPRVEARVTLSIGLAVHAGEARTGPDRAAGAAAEVMERADRALRRAKAAGRNTVTLARRAA
jgi:two-component system cell cycle response regulator